jgi:hypothetical protein
MSYTSLTDGVLLPAWRHGKVEAAVEAWWNAERDSQAQYDAYERLVGAIALCPAIAGGREDLATIADTFINMSMPEHAHIEPRQPVTPSLYLAMDEITTA